MVAGRGVHGVSMVGRIRVFTILDVLGVQCFIDLTQTHCWCWLLHWSMVVFQLRGVDNGSLGIEILVVYKKYSIIREHQLYKVRAVPYDFKFCFALFLVLGAL